MSPDSALKRARWFFAALAVIGCASGTTSSPASSGASIGLPTMSASPTVAPSASPTVAPSAPPTEVPTATNPATGPTPSPSTTPAPTQPPGKPGEFAWRNIASGDGISADWAPDGQHVALQSPDGVDVFDQSGNLLASAPGVRDPFWISATTVDAYTTSSFPDTSQGDGLGDFEMVPGVTIDVASPTPQPASLPCCYPVANGSGAVAITKYLPETDGLIRPQFAVWEDGQETAARDGRPLGWDLAGDKLVVFHPSEAGVFPDGWLEVVAWPNLSAVWESDPNKPSASSDVDFDGTGSYLAYPFIYQDGSGAWLHDVIIANLATGDTASVRTVSGVDVPRYTWNSSGQIIGVTDNGLKADTFSADGKKVAERDLPDQTAVIATADYSTLVTGQTDSNGILVSLVANRGAATTAMKAPFPVDRVYIAPDGLHIVITVESVAGETAYLSDVPDK